MTSVAFLVQRVGPYHHARFSAFAARRPGDLHVLEFRSNDTVYAWNPVEASGSYARIGVRDPIELAQALERIRPAVVVCTGYADPEVQAGATWAMRSGTPLVTCSDSTREDEPRSWAKEAFKRRVVGAFDAALVAGRRSRDYLSGLGLDAARCFQPWDVVDNVHFQNGVLAARLQPLPGAGARDLPSPYFLCVARFVGKKNLAALIRAYGAYRRDAGNAGWSLVLSGSGPLEGTLREQALAAGLADRVHFPGFVQYEGLPRLYGRAAAFVLPSLSDQWGLVVNEAMASGLPVVVSRRCGCAPELVVDGENGFGFDPEDETALAAALTRMATATPEERTRMGNRSRAIIAAFTPDAFAQGLDGALRCAAERKGARKPLATRAAVAVLARRYPR